nr:hypothetical protein [Enterobacter cloacae]
MNRGNNVSARERFFKKVQQSSKNTTSGNTSVEAEIVEFCERLEGLAQQIIEWFAGTSIEVTLSRQYLHDLSTLGYSLSSGICRYEIATILLQNGERSVNIVPEQLFRAGEMGCVRMRVEAPGFREVFYLSMAPEAGWFIRREFQSIKERALLTEERFFVAVDRLA